MKYIQKDITTVERGIIAHGVNCQHAMGSGVALAIRNKWPIVYKKYMAAPKGKVMLGTSQLIEVGTPNSDSLFVANCYTQVFYGRGGGKYASAAAVEQSLRQTLTACDWYDLDLYLPKIGAGLGGLDWDKDVVPRIESLNEDFSRVNIIVCQIGNK